MPLSPSSILLLALNVGLLWLLMTAPLGRRRIVMRRTFDAAPEQVWAMVHPLGAHATWSPKIIESQAGEGEGRVLQTMSHHDRRGEPIRRILALESIPRNGELAYAARVVEDSALDPVFWSNYSETRSVTAKGDKSELTVELADHYRGLAFFLYRVIMLRREMRDIEIWLKTGKAEQTGMLERPLTQVVLAVLSTLLLWPFLGLTTHGLMLSTILTVTIVFHELGHMAAYRAFGHQKVRMIFIPLLGGLAVGGRPYNSKLEVAVCALMGAGFSAFLVPIGVALHGVASESNPAAADLVLLFLLVSGAFNMLNLLPMSRFDGGQVIRQVFPTRDGLMGATFLVTAAVLWIGWRIGIPMPALYGGLAVMLALSLLTQVKSTVKPRHALDDMAPAERMLVGFAYYAALGIHGHALIFASDRLFG
jgi:Zn-dependent protease